jgi:hypothetical protein
MMGYALAISRNLKRDPTAHGAATPAGRARLDCAAILMDALRLPTWQACSVAERATAYQREAIRAAGEIGNPNLRILRLEALVEEVDI